MTSRILSVGAVLGLVLLCPLPVRADPISFGYNFETPNSVTGDSGNLGVISFATTNPGEASGSATVVAAKLAAVSAATASNPDTFSGESYSLTLQLTDTASGKTGSLTFTGQLFGSLSATAANITTSFATATQSLVLGNDEYSVTLGPLVPPTTPNPTVVGTLEATINPELHEVTLPIEPGIQTPEPTGLLLAAIGITGVAVARRPKRHELPVV
jgi:hypothetical protein